jgi:hypothetical protein
MTSYELLNEKKFKDILRTMLLHLGIDELDNTLTKVFDLIPKLGPKMLDEIVLNIDNNMIAKLKEVNQLFGKLTMNTIIDKSYHIKWQTLLFDSAKLQGLLIVKRIKKLIIDPSNKNQKKLVDEVNNGVKARELFVNRIVHDANKKSFIQLKPMRHGTPSWSMVPLSSKKFVPLKITPVEKSESGKTVSYAIDQLNRRK